eukprot:CAMPEP_0168446594 /NCGR_PEP_ID=MMETSP0228-20121227/46159_1 /TAXON_ID=133427 /ORGANISM="Protoceratium reticulatum, Strain CCCM 535 (=CCMP 1889)" /LENGTH=148 /DNA_ID=CAMNT_0008461101 /DNA_START=181 /DNA_END=628 /DNA_ORIENTATION=+
MVRIVNGEVGGSKTLQRRGSPLDKIADLFWSIVAFFVLFFQSMFSPKGGTFKPAKPEGKREEGGSIRADLPTRCLMGPHRAAACQVAAAAEAKSGWPGGSCRPPWGARATRPAHEDMTAECRLLVMPAGRRGAALPLLRATAGGGAAG